MNCVQQGMRLNACRCIRLLPCSVQHPKPAKCKSLSSLAATGSGCSYTVRPASAADVPRLAAIEQLCGEFSAKWSEAEIQDELGKSFSHVLVAADSTSGEALGYIVGWLIARELQVLELAVDPTQQSKGMGTALLAALLQQCGCCEGGEAVLEVKAHNYRAIRLYEKHGFAEVGLRKKYYADNSDALLMARKKCPIGDS